MQPEKLSCTKCGAEMLPDARFCRRCGHPSNNPASVTEVTTRRLENQGRPDPFMPGASAPSPLDKAPQGQTRPALSAETQALAQSKPTSALNRWLPGLIILFIAIILPTLYVANQWRKQQQIIVVPPRVAPGVPPAPPAPPTKTVAPGTTAKSSIDQSFIYPGARTTMVISRAGEGDVLRLETEDSLEKVSAWYTERLKPTERVVQPGSIILRTGTMTAIIGSDGKSTNIMLRQGAN